MDFVCATHGHCFDGLGSAVVFTRLLAKIEPNAKLTYRACGYGPNQPKADDSQLTGKQNAILDFRYSPASRLTWYFDHHRTAFANDADLERFQEQRASAPERFVFDPEYTSCTKLIADVARERYGVVMPELASFIDWADAIDSARFPSAQAAADVSNPVLQLASVVEHYGDSKLLTKLVSALLTKPLLEVATSGPVRDKYKSLGPRHERFLERVRARGELHGRVVHVDLTETTVDAIAKFATYAIYPEAVYSVVVSLFSAAVKISVGYNPWSGVERDVDLSAICARWGGGGHPVVGGISFPKSDLEKARSIALAIAHELAL